jgi:hypothetical protein
VANSAVSDTGTAHANVTPASGALPAGRPHRRWCVLFVEQAAAGAEGAEAAWDTLAAEVEEMEVERQAVFAKVGTGGRVPGWRCGRLGRVRWGFD